MATTPACQLTVACSSAAEHKSRSSGQQPQVSARGYSPSSPHPALRRTLAYAVRSATDPPRKHSTAKAAPTSPEATAREPAPHGRMQQHTRASSPERAHSGAQSASEATGATSHAGRRSREPRAQPQTAPAGSGVARRKTSPRKGKSSHISCTNNALSPKLRQNGGTMELGTPSQCFRKGFGGGYYQQIEPAKLEEFLADFSAPYKKIVHQPLYYGDGAVPPGMIRATLSQSLQRGFGVGIMQLAKQILKQRATGK